jgi:DNA-binding IclR family transcriptional regulator
VRAGLVVGSRKTGTAGVRSVLRAVALLRAFSNAKPHLSLAELAAASKLDKGTARRLLLTLQEAGLINQSVVDQRYSLSLAVIEFGAAVPESIDLRTAARPVLAQLARDMRSTIFLSVYRNQSALCLERMHDGRSIEIHWWPVGGSLPLNCGGAPKLLLSYQSEQEIQSVLRRPLARMTPKSITRPHLLYRRLKSIRKQGWEFAVDDVYTGLAALAVPVLDANGTLVAAISAAGVTPQMQNHAGDPVHLDLFRAAARKIELAIR